jgi:hypothetical protein
MRKPIHHIPKDTGFNIAQARERNTPVKKQLTTMITPQDALHSTFIEKQEEITTPQDKFYSTLIANLNEVKKSQHATIDTLHQDLQQILAAINQTKELIRCLK